MITRKVQLCLGSFKQQRLRIIDFGVGGKTSNDSETENSFCVCDGSVFIRCKIPKSIIWVNCCLSLDEKIPILPSRAWEINYFCSRYYPTFVLVVGNVKPNSRGNEPQNWRPASHLTAFTRLSFKTEQLIYQQQASSGSSNSSFLKAGKLLYWKLFEIFLLAWAN